MFPATPLPSPNTMHRPSSNSNGGATLNGDGCISAQSVASAAASAAVPARTGITSTTAGAAGAVLPLVPTVPSAKPVALTVELPVTP